ncbi:hypothetical protein ACOXXX_16805 [Thalassococcus sp. BH17M4-6]|uniref:hypothetical protein n=1 Tax=Thalassococcus sp. BH17M4-6 TaxID=3413148 RepID=UPI003BDFF5F4
MTYQDKIQPLRALSARISPMIDALRAPSPRPRTVPVSAGPAPILPSIDIPVRELGDDEVQRARYFAQGQFLARQEDWAELGRLIRTFDQQRLKTSGGAPVPELLARGARADAVEVAREAARRGDARAAHLPVQALEEVYAELGEDHGVALVVARTHLEIGREWHGGGPTHDLSEARKSLFLAHLGAAARIIDRFDAFERDAPSLAALRCDLLAAETAAQDRVADDYEDLIDLDPLCPRHMRALGRDLLPDRYGSYATLDAEARRTAARTADIWGHGGYAWVYFDALALDPAAFRGLDAELFVEGLHDILATRTDQHMANVLAAYTGLALSGRSARGSARARVADCFNWIVCDHLREIHPMIWAAAPTAANAAHVKGAEDGARRGRVRALSALAEHFASEIRAGHRIVFDPSGLTITP